MKAIIDTDMKKLRRIAHLIINPKGIKDMSDEELLLECLKMSTYAVNNIEIIKEEN